MQDSNLKVSVIGGGAWGTTLAQALVDNGHSVLIRDINEEFVRRINEEHVHPSFDVTIPENIKATTSLEEAINYSDYIVLCVPTKFMRNVLSEINNLAKGKKLFINVSKGIEPNTSALISQIVLEEISLDKYLGYVVLSGPSHAEELILRKFTSLVSASQNNDHAILVQKLFANNRYLRVYTTNDVIGVEAGGAIKNAIAFVSGVATGYGLGENARAALISRGMRELVLIVTSIGGLKETVYGLSGLGDLIVTASSLNSRNFQAGLRIGQGQTVEESLQNSKQTVEGVRAINAAYEIGQKYNLELPIINMAYAVIKGNLNVDEAFKAIFDRKLKSEE